MSSVLIDNIATLVTNDPELGEGPLGLIYDAAVIFDAGVVQWAGPRAQIPEAAAATRVDAAGRTLIPGFVDSHAHLVFAGDRAAEFSARMAGKPYGAGGIATTVAATRAATDEQLQANVARLVQEARRSGTTTIECKSGYGLSVGDELRSLQAAGAHTDEVTFLGDTSSPPSTRAGLMTTWTSSPARCSTPAPPTRAGSTSSVSAGPLTPSSHG